MFENNFYFDKCLPIVASISCSLYENILLFYIGLLKFVARIPIFSITKMIFYLALSQIHNVWPIPVNDLMQFICIPFVFRALTTYIAGLSHTHKLNVIEDHTKSFLVCKMLEGLRRKNPKRSDLRVPISLSLLKRLICALPHVCSSVYETFNMYPPSCVFVGI